MIWAKQDFVLVIWSDYVSLGSTKSVFPSENYLTAPVRGRRHNLMQIGKFTFNIQVSLSGIVSHKALSDDENDQQWGIALYKILVKGSSGLSLYATRPERISQSRPGTCRERAVFQVCVILLHDVSSVCAPHHRVLTEVRSTRCLMCQSVKHLHCSSTFSHWLMPHVYSLLYLLLTSEIILCWYRTPALHLLCPWASLLRCASVRESWRHPFGHAVIWLNCSNPETFHASSRVVHFTALAALMLAQEDNIRACTFEAPTRILRLQRSSKVSGSCKSLKVTTLEASQAPIRLKSFSAQSLPGF